MNMNLDGIVGRRAEHNLGLVTRAEALACGMTRHQIDLRLASGRWRRLGPSTYLITGVPPTWKHWALAASMLGGGTALVSHLTAAALWGLGSAPAVPHVTTPRGGATRSPIACVHRSLVAEEDRTQLGSIPVTRLGRTLVDCAAVASAAQLSRLVDAALADGRVSLADVGSALARAGHGVRRRGALLVALEPWSSPIVPESPAEARLLRRLGQWSFPAPVCQHRVFDLEGTFLGRVDLAWPEQRIGLEYDGARWHGPRQFEVDELRHAAITACGWRLLHTDRLDLRPGDDRLANELRAAWNARAST